MNRRQVLAAAGLASVAGCAAPFGGRENSRLDLTVRNDRPEPITVQVDVVADESTVYGDESDRIDSGVARAFEVSVGTTGRHVVTVSGTDFRGQLAWDADTCRRFDGTVGVAAEQLEVIGECAEPR